MDELRSCPVCGITWEGEEIPDSFMPKLTKEQAEVIARDYGWTPHNKKKFKINLVGIEDRAKYDGISYWHCTSCKADIDRWTGKICENPLPMKDTK